ncbi:MAG: DODA-type extradiol aromatic ring-opening family dioxygenase [Bacillota bacterium]
MIPSYFIAHGSPLLAIEENVYTKFLMQLGQEVPKPKAIVLFSAHWVSPMQNVSEVEQYSTIYDFGGFPDALYQIEYPAIGNKNVSEEITALFTKEGISFQTDTSRGLDHGAWVVLRMLYPNADIPVISMSVNPGISPEEQYKIGKSLSDLRKKDVMIIASGGTVHNLRALDWRDNGEVTPWALQFDEWLEKHLIAWDTDYLFNYSSLAPSAQLAVPTYGSEHFIPIFYAMGAADDKQKATLLHRSYRYGSLSHSIWQFG